MNEAKYRDAEARLWSHYGMQPDEKRVTLATTGTKVRVQVVGTGEPTLFIHGGPNAGSTWAPIVDSFADRLCLIVDRPGTGLSEPLPGTPSGSDIADLASRFVADVADGLDLAALDIVASSFGGYLALRSAATTPERVRRMVQMAAPALLPASALPPFMRLMTRTWVRRITGILPPNARVADSILRQIGHGKSLDAGRIPEAIQEWYLDMQRYTDTMRHDGDLIGLVATPSGLDPVVALTDTILERVTTPTLFLWGADDGFGGADVAEGVVAAMPNAELEMVRDAGHLPWLDFPAAIGARTAEYLGHEG